MDLAAEADGVGASGGGPDVIEPPVVGVGVESLAAKYSGGPGSWRMVTR